MASPLWLSARSVLRTRTWAGQYTAGMPHFGPSESPKIAAANLSKGVASVAPGFRVWASGVGCHNTTACALHVRLSLLNFRNPSRFPTPVLNILFQPQSDDLLKNPTEKFASLSYILMTLVIASSLNRPFG